MPATTSKGYPYPIGTDRIQDGDNAIQALAEAVDTRLGSQAVGGGVVFAGTVVNTTYTVAVTFPVGRFAAAPNVIAWVPTASPHQFFASANAQTTAGVNLHGVRTNGTGNFSGHWLAVQV